jgi:nuclear pore complex protein Nup188
MILKLTSSQPNESIAETIKPIKGLISAITLKLLSPTRSMAFLNEDVELDADEDPYLLGPGILDEINSTIMNAGEMNRTSVFPSVLAWCIIVHRMFVSYTERSAQRDDRQHEKSVEGFQSVLSRSGARRTSAGSIISLEGKPLDLFLQKSGLEKDMQIIEQMAMATTAGGKVYDVVSDMALCFGSSTNSSFPPLLSSRLRVVFVDFLNASYPLVGYQSDPASALHTVISGGQQYWDISADSLHPSKDVVASTLEDDTTLNDYIFQSVSRYPFEFLPFISFCQALCTSFSAADRNDLIINLLRKTPTITFVLPDEFQQYELAQEDENTNTFRIIDDLPLFVPQSTRARKALEDDGFRIPAGTFGHFVADSGRVVLMEYEHSALALLGRRLEVSLDPEAYHSTLGSLGAEEVSVSISLLSTLLRADYLRSMASLPTSQTPERSAHDILDEASKHISANRDILSIVCEIMDVYMQDMVSKEDDPTVAILTSCVEFLDAVLPLCPARVWSYMARCNLLSSESQAGKLTRVAGKLDLAAERFDFLLSSIKLFSNLVEISMTSAAQRKCGSKIAGRNKGVSNPWLGVADKILARVSLAIAQAAVDVFENSSTWRFASETQRTVLVRDVVLIMNNLITYSYNMGDAESPDALMACLRPASLYILDCFLSTSASSLRFQPILTTFLSAFQQPTTTLYPARTEALRGGLTLVLEFATTLLRVGNYLDISTDLIQTHLFKSSSLLSRLCVFGGGVKQPVLKLLQALVVNAGNSTNEPPSLLGYLGPQISRSFIQALSKLDKPYNVEGEVRTVWNFFSAIVRNRQQWMTSCLLTGRTPRQALKGNDKTTEASSDSVLTTAFTRLRSIKDMPSYEALEILGFVASAQDYWPWTAFTMEKDTAFLDSLRDYARELMSPAITVKSDATRAGLEARIAAYIAEIFSMQLFHLRQMGKADPFAKKLVNDLDYYLRDGVEVSGFNSSLHSNFAKNFSNRYPGCSLEGFKHTLLVSRELGTNYVYALDRANVMLNFDSGWRGARGNGFQHEMELANDNLSLVEAQVASTFFIHTASAPN